MSKEDVVVRMGADATGFVAGVESAAAEVEAIRANQAREDAALGAAWRRCEAALPEGWRMSLAQRQYDGVQARAFLGRQRHIYGYGTTPTAALLALAEKLESLP